MPRAQKRQLSPSGKTPAPTPRSKTSQIHAMKIGDTTEVTQSNRTQPFDISLQACETSPFCPRSQRVARFAEKWKNPDRKDLHALPQKVCNSEQTAITQNGSVPTSMVTFWQPGFCFLGGAASRPRFDCTICSLIDQHLARGTKGGAIWGRVASSFLAMESLL